MGGSGSRARGDEGRDEGRRDTCQESPAAHGRPVTIMEPQGIGVRKVFGNRLPQSPTLFPEWEQGSGEQTLWCMPAPNVGVECPGQVGANDLSLLRGKCQTFALTRSRTLSLLPSPSPLASKVTACIRLGSLPREKGKAWPQTFNRLPAPGCYPGVHQALALREGSLHCALDTLDPHQCSGHLGAPGHSPRPRPPPHPPALGQDWQGAQWRLT